MRCGVKRGDIIEVSGVDKPFVVTKVISASVLDFKRWGRIQTILSWNPCNDHETIWGL